MEGSQMKVTCDTCGCDMTISSSFRYVCPQCKHEIEMHWVQEKNEAYRDEHKKNIEWAKIKGSEVVVVK
jgi:uncharacterized Zn ribbon protein